MKKLWLALMLCPFMVNAQVTFVEHVVDSSAAAIGINKIVPVDFNLDGLQEVAVSKIGNNNMLYYENMGSNNFSLGNMIDDSINFAVDICSGDFDENGFPDLASFSLFDDSIYIHLSYNGTFGMKRAIAAATFFPIQLHASDLNMDGHLDLLAIDDTVVYIYFNDGMANFSQEVLISESEYYSGNIGDINDDGFPDVILGSVQIFTFLNNGDGTFTKDTRNDALINDFVFEIEITDINNDGYNDLGIYYSNTNPNIDWFENDSSGLFSFGGHITSSADDIKSMRFADINNNGMSDLVTAYGQTGELVWIENLGNGLFATEQVIKSFTILPREVAVSDVDNDGDIDVFCSHINKGLFYFENTNFNSITNEAAYSGAFYPNPARNSVKLTLEKDGSYSIIDMMGKAIVHQQKLVSGENEVRLNLNTGSYILKWFDGATLNSEVLMIIK